MASVLVVFDGPKEGTGGACLERRDSLELGKAQMAGIGKAISRPGSVEDVGNLMDVYGPARLAIPAARTGVHRSTSQLKESIESACAGSRSGQAHRRHDQRDVKSGCHSRAAGSYKSQRCLSDQSVPRFGEGQVLRSVL